MKAARVVFLSWLPVAVAIFGVCGTIYLAVQQNYRQSLNDPQIQMAEDGASIIIHGGVPADVVPHNATPVDIAQSLSTWIAVYDSAGTPLESTGILDNAPAQPPKGLFDNASWQGPIVGHHIVFNRNEDRVTWQPEAGVRQAIVIVPAGNMFVVAGRNMREVESREDALGEVILLGGVVTLLASLFFTALGYALNPHRVR